jgi:23S rRNA (uracil1939-C5)-methyltransferase
MTCPYYGECGGCQSQHIPYEMQVKHKADWLRSAVGSKKIQIFTGQEFGYRNRMDFIFHERGLGLRKKNSYHAIIGIEHCMIASSRINELLAELRAHFPSPDSFDLKKKTGTFRYAVIRAHSRSSISFVLNPDGGITEAGEEIKAFAEKTSADNVIVTYVPPETEESTSPEFYVVKGSAVLEESYLGKSFHYSAQGFFQNNHDMAEKMQRYVSSLLSKHDTRDASLLDLYGGVGTFGIVNAALFRSVTSVEAFQGCTDACNENIKENSISNMKAVCMDAAKLGRLTLGRPLYIITDPPRSGMDMKAIESIKSLAPELIVYISCNLVQLKKDMTKFRTYDLKSAALFDLFPQTSHAEAVVELARQQGL